MIARLKTLLGSTQEFAASTTARMQKDLVDSERELRSYFQKAIPKKAAELTKATAVAIIDPDGNTLRAVRFLLDQLGVENIQLIHLADPDTAVDALRDIPTDSLKAVLVQQAAIDLYGDDVPGCVLNRLYRWNPDIPLFVQGAHIDPVRVRDAAGNRFCSVPGVETPEFKRILTMAFSPLAPLLKDVTHAAHPQH
ncbi:MAG TPA: hypothetical protein VM537_02750 [Anaerolineae bacterium]|nr:hypothetical protein [Anaerolineae bacterium]